MCNLIHIVIINSQIVNPHVGIKHSSSRTRLGSKLEDITYLRQTTSIIISCNWQRSHLNIFSPGKHRRSSETSASRKVSVRRTRCHHNWSFAVGCRYFLNFIWNVYLSETCVFFTIVRIICLLELLYVCFVFSTILEVWFSRLKPCILYMID